MSCPPIWAITATAGPSLEAGGSGRIGRVTPVFCRARLRKSAPGLSVRGRRDVPAGVYRWPLMSAYAASKAALVKLTETLAEEARPHGVRVFSVDPGLLPIGLGEAALSSRAGRQTPEGRVHGWIRDQFAAGRGAGGPPGRRAGQRACGPPVRPSPQRGREP
jgi:NAD(P)-dependent dehydrogenase (short-subunit alcohol dehydrogenase family)